MRPNFEAPVSEPLPLFCTAAFIPTLLAIPRVTRRAKAVLLRAAQSNGVRGLTAAQCGASSQFQATPPAHSQRAASMDRDGKRRTQPACRGAA